MGQHSCLPKSLADQLEASFEGILVFAEHGLDAQEDAFPLSEGNPLFEFTKREEDFLVVYNPQRMSLAHAVYLSPLKIFLGEVQQAGADPLLDL